MAENVNAEPHIALKEGVVHHVVHDFFCYQKAIMLWTIASFRPIGLRSIKYLSYSNIYKCHLDNSGFERENFHLVRIDLMA